MIFHQPLEFSWIKGYLPFPETKKLPGIGGKFSVVVEFGR